jgi:hypothetical protein
MRALVVLLAIASCARPTPYVCATNSDCGDGLCESDGLCSVVDASCPSGRRYGELAGALAGACVGGDVPPSDEVALCGVTAARPDGTGTCAALVCDADPSCCAVSWDRQCARMAEARCELACDEIVAAAGFGYAAAFLLPTPEPPLFSTAHQGFSNGVAWGDIEGDGRPDLAIAGENVNLDVPGLLILQSSGMSNGTLTLTPASIGGDFVTNISEVEWRDFDADGDLDLLASGPEGIWVVVTQDGTFIAHRFTGNNAIATWLASSSTPPWRIGVVYPAEPLAELVVHTFDATFTIDSTTSLGMRNSAVATWCDVSGTPDRDLIVGGDVYIANSSGFAPAMSTSVTGYFPSCADLDGDGDNDLVVGDFGTVNIVLNAGGLTSQPTQFPIVFPSGLGIADFDNNGRLDILVSDGASTNGVEIPLVLIDNQPGSFTTVPMADWNTVARDSRGLDVGRPPR